MERKMGIPSVIVFGLALALSARVGRADLVARWPLNEVSGAVAHDVVGGHHGTVSGEAVWIPFRTRDRGVLQFDGKTVYITTPFILDPATGPFSAFARIDGTEAGRTILAQQDASGVGYAWLQADAAGMLAMDSLSLGRRGGLLASSTKITDGQGHHVGLVWDGQFRHLYVDGVEVLMDPASAAGFTSSRGGLVIGAAKTLDPSSFWSGTMMDVRIYDHALSAADVRKVYEGQDEGSLLTRAPAQVMVVAPKALYTGSLATLTITALQADGAPRAGAVSVWMSSAQTAAVEVFRGVIGRSGRLVASFDGPSVSPGGYSLEVRVEGIEKPLLVPIQVRQMPVVLIETDKPIYKPGQTIQGRVLVLTNELLPTASEASVQITDGKGVKIFRQDVHANAFGVAPFQLDLASELNYGTWKITAQCGSVQGEVDVRVEEYVLPRFDVKLETEKGYARTNEPITGAVRATYFFGKPVDGTVEVRASRYVSTWQEYARYTAPLSQGSATFSVPGAASVATRATRGGTASPGTSSVQLGVTVTDTTGDQEKETKVLKVVNSGLEHQILASSRSFTPGRPYEVQLVAQTPDGTPVTVSAEMRCTYYSEYYWPVSSETHRYFFTGSTPVVLAAPKDAAWALLESTAQSHTDMVSTSLYAYAAYSPTASFVHLSRAANTPVNAGETVAIEVYRTHEATVCYDVLANGHTVWSDVAPGAEIRFTATAQMVPAAKVVAYAVNPNNEVSADTLEFKVVANPATGLSAGFDAGQVLPGGRVQVRVNAPAEAMVGLALVDESVYALNAGRLTMEDVFSAMAKRFLEPPAATHNQSYRYGTRDVFDDAGLQVAASAGLDVPQGHNLWVFSSTTRATRGGGGSPELVPAPSTDASVPLAEVTRVRQYFPETWLWTPDLLTRPDGTATVDLEAPDSITTWRLHAVSTSQDGLGIAESTLRVFQEFFGEPDLPYSVTRGEQFPVRIQVFNYLNAPQVVQVQLAAADWFKLLGISEQQVQVDANSVGLASFLIQPTKLGVNLMEVTLRSPRRADAVRKEVLVEPEGTQRELVTNGLLRAGESLKVDASLPAFLVPGSGKLLLNLTPSLVAQSMSGMDNLLHMPYGCGEQNMVFFAPDVEVLQYLDATGQATPEVRAKAGHFITCGYQRELTYRRSDGSFSAFGEHDPIGSLWLTAFVLDCFSSARDVTTVDETVLAQAALWITSKQLPDGSWKPVGFLHSSSLAGGAQGTYALTAYVTIALADYGAAPPAVMQNAVKYLKDNLSSVRNDAYGLAIAALAFVRAGDATADTALDGLLALGHSSAAGLHWEPQAVETTAYAALALIEKHRPQASEAIRWLALQRNSLGGYGSTQDTVLALKALMTAARNQSRAVDLTVTARGTDGTGAARFVVNHDNFDVLQTAELPLHASVELAATGTGEVHFQLVRRFHVLLRDQSVQKDMTLEVTYDADHVEIDDVVSVEVKVRYAGDRESTGMMIVDVGVPTGFDVVRDSLETLRAQGTITKSEVGGRKVILYLNGLKTGEPQAFRFQVKARFPVRAVIPDSAAYSYYEPQIRAEAAGKEIIVDALEEKAR